MTSFSILHHIRGWRSGVTYDVSITLLIHFDGRFKERLKWFKRFGLLNYAGKTLHVFLIASVGDASFSEEILAGWPPGIDVTLIEVNSAKVVAKINTFYLWRRTCAIVARWHFHVDDDSITDIESTLEYLDARFGRSAVHVSTSPIEIERFSPHFLKFVPEKKKPFSSFLTDWESSATSEKAMKAILEDESFTEFLIASSDIAGPGDRMLSIGAHLAGIPLVPSARWTKNFSISEFSAFGGRWSHVHYVPWDDVGFVERLGLYFSLDACSIDVDLIRNLASLKMTLERSGMQIISTVELCDSGEVEGFPGGSISWECRNSELHFRNQEWGPVICFHRAVRSGGSLMFRGFNIEDGEMRLLFANVRSPQKQV